jgi:hypothetical protein
MPVSPHETTRGGIASPAGGPDRAAGTDAGRFQRSQLPSGPRGREAVVIP